MSPPDAPLPARAGWPLLLTFCAIWSGLIVTESVTDGVLPLTLGRSIAHAGLIGMVLATKPLFGFIAQPLVGIWSDRCWTPLGRRALFLLVSAPIVALCLWAVPRAGGLGLLVSLVVTYQLFQDIAWGSDHPLMADLIPPAQRTLLMGLILTLSQLIGYLFYRFGMGKILPVFGEASLYRAAAVAQIALVAGGALCLRERPPTPRRRPPLGPRQYLADFLGDPRLRRFGLLAFLQGLCKFAVVGYAVLFATRTLGMTRGAFGGAWALFSALALGSALPFGIAIERFVPKQRALAIGYTIVAFSCVAGFASRSANELALVAALLGLGHTLVEVVQKPFYTEHLPADIIGQLSGAYNICYALGRTLAMAGVGWLITLRGEDYRLIWLVAAVAAGLAIAVAWPISDRRFAARTSEPKNGR